MQDKEETIKGVATMAIVMATVSFMCMMYTVFIHANTQVYFALGLITLVTAVIWTVSSALKTVCEYSSKTMFDSAGVSWILSAVWFFSVINLFGTAAFGH